MFPARRILPIVALVLATAGLIVPAAGASSPAWTPPSTTYTGVWGHTTADGRQIPLTISFRFAHTANGEGTISDVRIKHASGNTVAFTGSWRVRRSDHWQLHHACHNGRCLRGAFASQGYTFSGHWNIPSAGGDHAFTAHAFVLP